MEELLQRYIRGDVSEEEKRQLIDWLDRRPENRREYLALRKLYDISLWNAGEAGTKASCATENTTTPGSTGKSTADETAKQRPEKSGRPATLRRIATEIVKIAAILVIGFFGARYLFTDGPDNPRMQTIRVPAGQRAQLTLADGTGVWLNSRSTLTFPDRFEAGSRQVTLDGEGYFTVAHDEKKPFTVKTGRYDIRVLGTEFNVKAYHDSQLFETALLKGSVEIASAGNRAALRLKPNQQASLAGGKLVTTTIPDSNYFKWKEGLFSFENETVENLIEKLQLYYDIRIEVRRPALLRHRYSGKFRIKDGIEHVLKVLQLKHTFTYTKDEELNLIIIE